ncbi:acetate/propionate family kinase [uncultured Litoreibacter sp.]|uniref:acetate/propionate family kinase n=1 Tax=uncultured Litoreibacter sp. TaxID=1392394 RepID=UPI002629B189|nr:acetate/propionate family kinase [uncultured Litoreibacter sp.]
MPDVILTINAGSSSLKFALHPVAAPLTPVLRGKITGLKRAPEFSISVPKPAPAPVPVLDPRCTHEDAARILLDWLAEHARHHKVVAVGHRVVHGGRDFTGPAKITPDVVAQLAALTPLAPLHQPHNLASVRLIANQFPNLPQVACFDTSFHTTQTPLAKLFAIPQELTETGLVRYGFHGLSYEFIASTLPEHLGDKANGRVIVAHLGNGASLCAMENGESRATTMGFTALDGLVMGRRSGSIDPGVILHLVQQRGMSVPEIEKLLYQQSGLLGVSGISNAMQDLQASDDPRAKLAMDLFCYRAAAEIAALIPAIGGLDVLIFTAGIGENSAQTRAGICDRLGWLGITLDASRNGAGDTRINADDARCDVLVIPTNEDAVIAQHTVALT